MLSASFTPNDNTPGAIPQLKLNNQACLLPVAKPTLAIPINKPTNMLQVNRLSQSELQILILPVLEFCSYRRAIV